MNRRYKRRHDVFACLSFGLLCSTTFFLNHSNVLSQLWKPPESTKCDPSRPVLTFLNLGHQGRLGNQLFQAAAVVGLAMGRGLCWAFPLEAAESDLGQLIQPRLWSAAKIDNDRKTVIHSEKEPNYYDIDLSFSNGAEIISLEGYFQSPRYFDFYRGRIRALFAYKSELVEAVDARFSQWMLQRAVGIHIRRGDYLSEPQTYINLGIDYYEQALEILNARITGGIELVVVVSNDIEWCRRNLVGRLPYTLVFSPFGEEKDELGNYLDFVLLASCRHLVIANSSFSWWAAYLKRHAETGLVVAPRPWYNPTSRLGNMSNNIDFYPAGWYVLSVKF